MGQNHARNFKNLLKVIRFVESVENDKVSRPVICRVHSKYSLFCCTVHSVLYLINTPTNAHIQGVPGGMCNTSGGCSLGQTIPI